MNSIKCITVCGSGNGAHVVVGQGRVKDIRLFTLSEDKLQLLGKSVTVSYRQRPNHKDVACPVKVGSDPSDLIPEADLLILMVPICAYEPYMRTIKPYLSPRATVVTLQSQGGIRALFDSIPPARSDINLVVTDHFPLVCRISEFGKSVIVAAEKDMNSAVIPSHNTDLVLGQLNQVFSGTVREVSHPLVAALAPSNWALHIPIVRFWLEQERAGVLLSSALLYKDLTEIAFKYMLDINEEFKKMSQIIAGQCQIITLPSEGDVFNFFYERTKHYFDETIVIESIEDLFLSNPALVEIKVPVTNGFFDINTRMLWEDVPYGLVPSYTMGMIVFGDQVRTEMPTTCETLLYLQEVMDREFINPTNPAKLGKDFITTGSPQRYGIETVAGLLDQY